MIIIKKTYVCNFRYGSHFMTLFSNTDDPNILKKVSYILILPWKYFHAPCSSFGTHHLGLDRLVLLLDQPHALHPLTLPPLASLPVNTCLFRDNDNQSRNNNIIIIMK